MVCGGHRLLCRGLLWTVDFIRKHLDEEQARFARSRDNPKPQFALEARTGWIATLMFFHEMALAGYPKNGRLDVTPLAARIEGALADLAAWLSA